MCHWNAHYLGSIRCVTGESWTGWGRWHLSLMTLGLGSILCTHIEEQTVSAGGWEETNSPKNFHWESSLMAENWRLDACISYLFLKRIPRVLQPKKRALRSNCFKKHFPKKEIFCALLFRCKFTMTFEISTEFCSFLCCTEKSRPSWLWDWGTISLNATQRCSLSFSLWNILSVSIWPSHMSRVQVAADTRVYFDSHVVWSCSWGCGLCPVHNCLPGAQCPEEGTCSINIC